MRPPSKPVFLSYARSASRSAAQALFDELGPDVCFFDIEDIAHYERFPERIAEALLGARLVVVFFTSTYFERWYCLREWLLARAPVDSSVNRYGTSDEEMRLGQLPR